MKRISFILVLLVLALGFALVGCSKPAPQASAAAPAAAAAPAKVSDNSEDLKIDFRLNTAKADPENYFTFSGNIRYMALEKDQVDEATGASKLGSTEVFHAYLYDVEGKNTMSGGLRGLFLFAVNPYDQIVIDNLKASKASDGTIMVQYAHRGTAYRITTDSSGKLSFPNGKFEKRTIGYIVGAGPQVISRDFSADGTAATIDWAKVWDSSIKGGTVVTEGVDRKTGDIGPDGANPGSMYFFDGTLSASLANDVLTIGGFLTAVPR